MLSCYRVIVLSCYRVIVLSCYRVIVLSCYQLPRNLRMMYAHSYQSYVWNHAVTARLSLLSSTKPVIGDLVLVSAADAEKADAASSAGDGEPDADQLVDEDAPATTATDDSTSADSKDDSSAGSGGSSGSGSGSGFGTDPSAQKSFMPRVKVLLSEADVAAHTLADVVLPLPGHSVVFPRHAVTDRYKQLMESDGMSLDTFRSHPIRDFALCGSYRKIVSVPGDFRSEVFRYDDPTIPLAVTDADRIENKPPPQSIPTGKHVAAVLSFSLPASTYATMLIRELTKQSTAVSVQRNPSGAVTFTAAAAGGDAKTTKDTKDGQTPIATGTGSGGVSFASASPAITATVAPRPVPSPTVRPAVAPVPSAVATTTLNAGSAAGSAAGAN